MPQQKNTVSVVDKGWNALVEEARKYTQGVGAKVGVQGSQAQLDRGEGWTNVQNAAVHEFGVGVPERSFMRTTFEENRPKYLKEWIRIGKGFFEGGTVRGQILLLGEDYRADILKKIKGGIGDPVEGRTALIKTGQLLNSFSVELVDMDAVQR